MIYVTRLDGSQLVVNADLIETVEHTAGTVISLVDGKRLIVATSVDEIVEKCLAYRQRVGRGSLRVLEHHHQPAERPSSIRPVRRRRPSTPAQAEADAE